MFYHIIGVCGFCSNTNQLVKLTSHVVFFFFFVCVCVCVCVCLCVCVCVFFFFFFCFCFLFFFLVNSRRAVVSFGRKNARKYCLTAYITKKCLFKYTEKLITEKLKNFRQNIQIFFHISAQNIDCGYSLEPPRRGGSNEYPQSMFLS